jgi:beta-lactamase regulating signal transducer with metallopeptidase domain
MIELLLRTSALLVITWISSLLVWRATAATRHLLWHLAIIGVLVAPLASLVLPKLPIVPAAVLTFAKDAGGQRAFAAPTVAVEATATAAAVIPGGQTFPFIIVWLVGSGVVLLGFVCSHVAARRLVCRSFPCNERIQSIANQHGTELGQSTPIPVCLLDSQHGPFTRGVTAPVIVLPLDAELWDEARLRSVLLHELAHVRRRDCLAQMLAQLACALYWFNPLVWLAAHALRVTRERACDDEVLARGAQPSAYANDLLEIARGIQHPLAARAVLAIARASELEARLRAILSSRHARVPRGASRWAVGVLILLTTMVSLGAQMVTEAPVPPRPTAASPVASSPQDRERAALLLALDANADVVPALITALQDNDSQVREKAALGLGWRNDARVVAPLITALQDQDSQVREKAAIALGSSGQPAAAGALESALHDPDAQVREKAAAGLMLLETPITNGDEMRRALNSVVKGLLALAQ